MTRFAPYPDWRDVALDRIATALQERNQIEKAKLAEMRAARVVYDPTESPTKVEALSATADRLTAEALGEEETTND